VARKGGKRTIGLLLTNCLESYAPVDGLLKACIILG